MNSYSILKKLQQRRLELAEQSLFQNFCCLLFDCIISTVEEWVLFDVRQNTSKYSHLFPFLLPQPATKKPCKVFPESQHLLQSKHNFYFFRLFSYVFCLIFTYHFGGFSWTSPLDLWRWRCLWRGLGFRLESLQLGSTLGRSPAVTTQDPILGNGILWNPVPIWRKLTAAV